ncbi:Lactase-like protein [Galemys pyrenaicus]|uniref:Lactase-like protein n=1 Tax=Galemys pyrenaicus TaxID=202257 RepID=A0A8J5ZJR8_GALPY|nr:Lactase-like protein [Galemys pyrenaicus]
MKPMPGVTLSLVLLLVSRLKATRKGSVEEASFYYGNFPLGFSWAVLPSRGCLGPGRERAQYLGHLQHSGKGKVFGDKTADVACDGYYKIQVICLHPTPSAQEDIVLLRELHVSHSYSPCLGPGFYPQASESLFTSPLADQVNEKGIQFYSDLIDALLKSNITPIVTAPLGSSPSEDRCRITGHGETRSAGGNLIQGWDTDWCLESDLGSKDGRE